MATPLQPAQLDWSQGLPFASAFGDIYFSQENGDAETQHVFLAANQLEPRFSALTNHQPFTIIETGFGTGLNWLCTQRLWEKCQRPGWLHYISIEKHPLTLTDLRQAHTLWPLYKNFSEALQKNYPALAPGFHRLFFPELRSTLTLVFSDIQTALPQISAQADTWFLDGFAPDKNPAMWQPYLYENMARLSHEGSTFSTFTAAGFVRRGLQTEGFIVEKVPGYGKKREMLCGHFSGHPNSEINSKKQYSPAEKPWLYRPPTPSQITEQRSAIIIGAGIAGATTAYALAQRGWHISVLDKHAIADGASGNPAAVVALTPCTTEDVLSHFPQQAGLHTLRVLKNEAPTHDRIWNPCGVLELAATNHQKKFSASRAIALPKSLWSVVSPDEASQLSGITLQETTVWQAQSGWLDAKAWCRFLLNHPNIHVYENHAVSALIKENDRWQVHYHSPKNQQSSYKSSPVIILANGYDALALLNNIPFPLRAVRGQVARFLPTEKTAKLQSIIAAQTYITPADNDGYHCLGASFIPDDLATDIRLTEHESIRTTLATMLPALETDLEPCPQWLGRSSIRCQSEDYLPLIGRLASPSNIAQHYAGLRDGKLHDYPLLQPIEGLYINLAYGSHGFSYALLGAEILASELNNEPAPCARTTLENLNPIRFFIRQLKRGKI